MQIFGTNHFLVLYLVNFMLTLFKKHQILNPLKKILKETDLVTRTCCVKKMFLKISQNFDVPESLF